MTTKNDRSLCEAAMIYLQKGEQITCEGGHIICEVARDIHSSEPMNSAVQLTNWTQEPPKISTPLPILCERCKLPFARGGTFFGQSVKVHTNSGWR